MYTLKRYRKHQWKSKMADYTTEILPREEKKPMSFDPPSKSKPFDWKTYGAEGAAEKKRKQTLREGRDTNQPSGMGFNFQNLTYGPKKRLERMTPHSFHSYRDYVDPIYKNYPGGFEGERARALAYQKKIGNNFQSKDSVALAPRLQHDWPLVRKNPVFLNTINNPQDTDTRYASGTAYIDTLKDKRDGADYTAIDMWPRGVVKDTTGKNPPLGSGVPNSKVVKNEFDKLLSRGIKPAHALAEELTHGTQPSSGNNTRYEDGSEKPYGLTSLEGGAKLTGLKHQAIQKLRPGELFMEKNAAEIIDNIIKGKKTGDWGLDTIGPRGIQYIKDNRDDYIQFMMSTASNERREPKIPGMFTGPNRYA